MQMQEWYANSISQYEEFASKKNRITQNLCCDEKNVWCAKPTFPCILYETKQISCYEFHFIHDFYIEYCPIIYLYNFRHEQFQSRQAQILQSIRPFLNSTHLAIATVVNYVFEIPYHLQLVVKMAQLQNVHVQGGVLKFSRYFWLRLYDMQFNWRMHLWLESCLHLISTRGTLFYSKTSWQVEFWTFYVEATKNKRQTTEYGEILIGLILWNKISYLMLTVFL